MARRSSSAVQPELTASFESTLWKAADALRNNMDAAEYKHVVLGIVFLKYISDAFEERRAVLIADGDDPEDRDGYTMENVFWVPTEARWQVIQNSARLPEIGKVVDDAMFAIIRAAGRRRRRQGS